MYRPGQTQQTQYAAQSQQTQQTQQTQYAAQQKAPSVRSVFFSEKNGDVVLPPTTLAKSETAASRNPKRHDSLKPSTITSNKFMKSRARNPSPY